MSKFVNVEWTNDFEAIREYILKNKGNSYYIAPKLMHRFLSSIRVNCVAGVRVDDIKVREQYKIEFATIPVYNRVFETNVFRLEGIRVNNRLIKTKHKFEYNDVVFGLDEDESEFACYHYEELN